MAHLTGNLFTIVKEASIQSLVFYLKTPGVLSGNDVYHGSTKRVTPEDDGSFTVELGPGDYDVKIGNSTTTVLTVSMPDNDTTYGISQRVVEDSVYVPTTPAGGNQPNASSTVLGLVKTDSDPGSGEDPIVPLLSTVQAMIAGGVTVTSIGGVPTMDFSNSDRIHILFANNKVLELGVSSSGALIQNVIG